VTIYFDGVSVATGMHTIGNWTPSGGDQDKMLVIGSKYPTAAGNYAADALDGKLDNVCVYARVLDADAVHRLAIDPPPIGANMQSRTAITSSAVSTSLHNVFLISAWTARQEVGVSQPANRTDVTRHDDTIPLAPSANGRRSASEKPKAEIVLAARGAKQLLTFSSGLGKEIHQREPGRLALQPLVEKHIQVLKTVDACFDIDR
jgi:hypothetical protein